jgi:hypothetical protein
VANDITTIIKDAIRFDIVKNPLKNCDPLFSFSSLFGLFFEESNKTFFEYSASNAKIITINKIMNFQDIFQRFPFGVDIGKVKY